MEVGKDFLGMKTKAAHNLCSPPSLLFYSFPKLALFFVLLLDRDKLSTS